MADYNGYTGPLVSSSSTAVAQDSPAWPQLPGSTGSPIGGAAITNPRFESVTASKFNPNTGGLMERGYIRRTPTDSDPTSKYILNFMFNPTQIKREYVAYLDQSAIDPYNTIYNAGNLVAPPGMLDFSFELLYDRQVEARKSGNRGCLVDYDYFDRVIRAVEPGQSSPTSPPDSGILLVNPRDVTVVFGPKLIVTGRVYSANVVFERFSSTMVPTRMRIVLRMKVYSFGTITQPLDFFSTNVETTHSSVIQYENTVKAQEASFDPGDGTDKIMEMVKSSGYSITDIKSAAQSGGSAGSGGSGGGTGGGGGGGTYPGTPVPGAGPAGIDLNNSKRADARGWGGGWPSGEAGQYQTTITFKDGLRDKVHREIAPLVLWLVNETERRGYNVRMFSGYYNRPIRGSSTVPSNHSWGLAVDINWDVNPMQAPLRTDMPPWMWQMWNAWGFRWGGTYRTRPDSMHYEFMGTPDDARRLVTKLNSQANQQNLFDNKDRG